MKVVIVGAGNVATVFGRAIHGSGHQVAQVVNRNPSHAADLAGLFNCSYTSNLTDLVIDADFYLLAVADKSIVEIAENIKGVKGVVVHTAGSVSKDVLTKLTDESGVIYPVQSLNKQLQTLPPIPVLIDGSTTQVTEKIKLFAASWCSRVEVAGDEQRMHTHVAAIIVNNFTNHLMALTQDYCNKEDVDFTLLQPLIKQTISRLEFLPAAELQTGPAARNDIATIEKHLQLLHKQTNLRNLYLKLSESIVSFRKKQPA